MEVFLTRAKNINTLFYFISHISPLDDHIELAKDEAH